MPQRVGALESAEAGIAHIDEKTLDNAGSAWAEGADSHEGARQLQVRSEGKYRQANLSTTFGARKSIIENFGVPLHPLMLFFRDTEVESEFRGVHAIHQQKHAFNAYVILLVFMALAFGNDLNSSSNSDLDAEGPLRLRLFLSYGIGMLLPLLVGLTLHLAIGRGDSPRLYAAMWRGGFSAFEVGNSFVVVVFAVVQTYVRFLYSHYQADDAGCFASGDQKVVGLIILLPLMVNVCIILFNLLFPSIVIIQVAAYVYFVGANNSASFDTQGAVKNDFYAYLGLSMLVSAFVFHGVEYYMRVAFLRERKVGQEKEELAKDVESLKKQLDSGKSSMPDLDLDSPMQKVLAILDKLRSEPSIAGLADEIDFVVKIVTSTGTSAAEDLRKQLAEGRGGMDSEMQSWLLAQAGMTKDEDKDDKADAGAGGAPTGAEGGGGSAATSPAGGATDVDDMTLHTPRSARDEKQKSRNPGGRRASLAGNPPLMGTADQLESSANPAGMKFAVKLDLSQLPSPKTKSSQDASFYDNAIAGAAGRFLDQNLGQWDLDVFELDKVCNGRPLFIMGNYLIRKLGLIEKLGLNAAKLHAFLAAVEAGYRPDVDYHNAMHAADVTHTLYCLLAKTALRKHLQPLDLLAALTAAVIHDYNHPGLNNGFNVATASTAAVIYNDKAVLENYHVAAGFTILAKDSMNFMEDLTDQEFRTVRSLVVDLILATDMSQHFDIVSAFKMRMQSLDSGGGVGQMGYFVPDSHEDKKLLMRIALKVSDISNPAKPTDYFEKWTNRVQAEFFSQGDYERELGLPISPFMDRNDKQRDKSTVGFIDFICRPLYEAWCAYIEDKTLENILDANRDYWIKNRVEKASTE